MSHSNRDSASTQHGRCSRALPRHRDGNRTRSRSSSPSTGPEAGRPRTTDASLLVASTDPGMCEDSSTGRDGRQVINCVQTRFPPPCRSLRSRLRKGAPRYRLLNSETQRSSAHCSTSPPEHSEKSSGVTAVVHTGHPTASIVSRISAFTTIVCPQPGQENVWVVTMRPRCTMDVPRDIKPRDRCSRLAGDSLTSWDRGRTCGEEHDGERDEQEQLARPPTRPGRDSPGPAREIGQR